MMQLVYVSRATFRKEDELAALNSIISSSHARCADLNVTGGLIFCNGYFAELLEGPSSSIAELMDATSTSGRHDGLTVLATNGSSGRQMSDWRVAYWGSATYVSKKIRPLVACSDEQLKTEGFNTLKSLIVELAA